MTTSSSVDHTQPDSTPTEFSQEIRFAVVMYGGSSLAVYMNGVAQELLKLVRATAERPNSLDPNTGRGIAHRNYSTDREGGTERVYRELGQMLVRGQRARLGVKRDDAIRTKFVVDIISGTSAGGINGVFLAKALTCDEDLTSLRELWVNTADFDRLLNDRQGEAPPQKPPKSLVNSPLMYSKLFRALEGMDDPNASRPDDWESPYVDALDLFTTFTDVQGQTIALKLADDTIATERQHLHNFHFGYRTKREGEVRRNDFTRVYNPFLAFAARATSAHQAAFEPVALNDIGDERGCDPMSPLWKPFYDDYLQPLQLGRKGPAVEEEVLAEEFRKRPLADGGVLDNKPFSFAISQIQSRQARLPVDRKLIYIEPAPEHPERTIDSNQKPDALTNAILALSTIPSYEFIRDDIRRVLDRNRLIERVNRILKGIEEERGSDASATTGYLGLRVGETADELGNIVALAAGFRIDSDESLAIRYLARAWRQKSFSRKASIDKLPEEDFLNAFDFKYEIRRLKFVLRIASELSSFDKRATKLVQLQKGDYSALGWNSEDRKSLRLSLFRLIGEMNATLELLYDLRRKLSTPVLENGTSGNPLAEIISELQSQITAEKLRALLLKRNDDERLDDAKKFIAEFGQPFEKLAGLIKEELEKIKGSSFSTTNDRTVDRLYEVLKDTSRNAGTTDIDYKSEVLVKTVLSAYWERFDTYDAASFPILYATDAGEELDPIDVFRVSPEDAKRPKVPEPEKKLAGLKFGHFGALLDSRYRVNDILWGRLDAAERLITLLLSTARPPEDEKEMKELIAYRNSLIDEAQEAIVRDELSHMDGALLECLGFAGGRLDAGVSGAEVPTPFRDRFVNNFHRLKTSDTKKLVHVLGRSSHIVGGILDDVADQHGFQNPLVTWITRLLRMFWGFVEISMPDSLVNLVMLHLFKLLYFVEVLIVVLGYFVRESDMGKMLQLGLLALAATGMLNVASLLLRDLMSQKHRLIRGFVALIAACLILSTLLGGTVIAAVFGFEQPWKLIQSIFRLK